LDDRLVTIARYTNQIEADFARQLLADYGIKAVVTGQNVATIYAHVPGVIDIELQTFESQAQKAVEILRSQQKQEQ